MLTDSLSLQHMYVHRQTSTGATTLVKGYALGDSLEHSAQAALRHTMDQTAPFNAFLPHPITSVTLQMVDCHVHQTSKGLTVQPAFKTTMAVSAQYFAPLKREDTGAILMDRERVWEILLVRTAIDVGRTIMVQTAPYSVCPLQLIILANQMVFLHVNHSLNVQIVTRVSKTIMAEPAQHFACLAMAGLFATLMASWFAWRTMMDLTVTDVKLTIMEQTAPYCVYLHPSTIPVIPPMEF